MVRTPRSRTPSSSDGGELLTLHIDLTTDRGLTHFLQGINDPHIRTGLKRQKAGVPKGVSEIVTMVDDPIFLDLAHKAARSYASMVKNNCAVDQVKKDGELLQGYLQSNYSEGFGLLQQYARRAAPVDMGAALQRLADSVEVNADVAANVEVVVNAAVYANVAAATDVAVALIVVVVIGVFVI